MHFSPQVAVVEASGSILLFLFCISHVWQFDRFRSLAFWHWTSLQSFFRRLMVLIYLLGLPMFAVRGIALADIKYEVGFLPVSLTGNPVPYQAWSKDQQAWIAPVTYMYAVAWMCEVIVHAEETCFWWYLTSLKAHSGSWFGSPEVKIFIVTSILSIVALIIPALTEGGDPLLAEALITTIGSSIVFLQNCVFLHLLRIFPQFLLVVSAGQSSSDSHYKVISRLANFHEMNKLRVVARFLFSMPALTLGIDGLKWEYLNSRVWVVDFFMITLFMAFLVQSIITFLVFLPCSRADIKQLSGNLHREAGLTSSFVSGNSPEFPIHPTDSYFLPHTTSPHDLRTGRYPPTASFTVNVGRAYFDIEGQNLPTYPGGLARKGDNLSPGKEKPTLGGRWVIPEVQLESEVTEELETGGGRVRARRPSLVLRPRLHPAVMSFRSPVRNRPSPFVKLDGDNLIVGASQIDVD